MFLDTLDNMSATRERIMNAGNKMDEIIGNIKKKAFDNSENANDGNDDINTDDTENANDGNNDINTDSLVNL